MTTAAASSIPQAASPRVLLPIILGRLATDYLDAIAGMTGVTAEPEESEEYRQTTFSSPGHMIAMLDFTGSVVGFLAVSVEEQTIANALGMGELPPEDERDALRTEYEGFLLEVLNSVSGDCLTVLRDEDHSITILTPKLIYGVVSYPKVASLTRRIATSIGTFYFTVTIDTMQLEVNRMTRRLKASEEELINSKLELERTALELRKALQAPSEAIIIHDDGRVLEVNEAFTEIFGYDQDDAIGRDVLEFVEPTSQDAVTAHVRTGSEEPYEVVARRADGTTLPVEVRGRAIEYQDRVVRVAAVRDLSEHKRVQKALQESENQLRHAQKMEAIGRLAAGVAHDFRNLVSIITAQCDMLLAELGEGNRLAQRVEEILTAGERATSLTKQLLAFARKQAVQPTVLDVSTIVSGMSEMLASVLGSSIKLEITTTPNLGRVNVDRGQVEQTIMNLAVNAVDAMPDGGELKIATDNVTLDEAYIRSHPAAKLGKYVMLSVSDTGSGIDLETQARVFEPFFTTKAEGKGTGLGLAMVYGAVEQAGGIIELDSEVDVGTTFRIYLPRWV
ncbi:MAG: PAS domain S-box protein [Gemmatimonadetes bacterium]|nr:PAS domain S-box protein [Gemmatimonadota bacterium]